MGALHDNAMAVRAIAKRLRDIPAYETVARHRIEWSAPFVEATEPELPTPPPKPSYILVEIGGESDAHTVIVPVGEHPKQATLEALRNA